MGYDLLAAVFFIATTPLVLAGFVLFWVVNARDHEELASIWRAFAAKRGLGFIEPENDWPNRTSPIVTCTDGDAELRISARGREADVRTRLTVRPRSALLGRLVIRVDPHGADLRVLERPAGFARRIVTDRVRRGLLGFRQREQLTFRYQRGRVIIEWPGGERNDARLDEALRLGVEIARTIDAEFAGVASAHKPAA